MLRNLATFGNIAIDINRYENSFAKRLEKQPLVRNSYVRPLYQLLRGWCPAIFLRDTREDINDGEQTAELRDREARLIHYAMEGAPRARGRR